MHIMYSAFHKEPLYSLPVNEMGERKRKIERKKNQNLNVDTSFSSGDLKVIRLNTLYINRTDKRVILSCIELSKCDIFKSEIIS